MQKAFGPKEWKAFRDNYLAAGMLILALFFSFGAKAQYDSSKLRQVNNAYGFDYKNLKSYTFVMPNDTPKMAVADSGAMAYKGGKDWRWTGHYWKILTGSGGTTTGGGFSLRPIFSSNFVSTVDCPLPALNGDSLQIFWNDLNRFLQEGIEWVNLPGGGFTITLPGFDATAAGYSFSVYSNSGSTTPGPAPVTSADFSTSVNCPLTAFNGMQLQIFWNDANRYLVQGVDWTPLAAGGFTITIPGFDATTFSYSFYIFNQ